MTVRTPLAPPGYRLDSVRDKSWDERRRTKAVAVTFRTSTGDPLFVIYRLEPEWVLEDAAEMSSIHCLNLLQFYPWSQPESPQPARLQADLSQEAVVPNALRIDGQPVNSYRFVVHDVVVDMVFLPGISIGIARPANAALPDLQTGPYESLRPELPATDSGEYRGYLEERPGGNFRSYWPGG
ncbi:hypothetical protein [Jatrophihabitans sp.]|uniref:hypothetical protein n=1 Tax=Jatrophihabitans sp. TaxID=1932789 RepID=UPI002C0C5F23|nr:hypothetical protein [Jatrophihabitans sp.]